jgi:transposase-like protein/ribosomal protein L37AE/L43A
MTYDEFEKRFAREEDCRKYLYELRFPKGYHCPKCGNGKSWEVGETLYECSKCGHQASIIAGTIFQDTRKPLRTWFIAIWWITTQKYGASAKGLQQILGLKSYQTAWMWLHKIRTAMVVSGREKLSGTVEMDESYVGGEKSGKRGRGSENKSLIAVAVEVDGKKLGRIRLELVKDASKASLHGFIEQNIAAGSEIITDDWSGYSGIETEGYSRTIYSQTKAVSVDELLPHVHLVISLLKRWLLGTHQGAVQEVHLQAYLNEFVFRFNRRTAAQRGLLFYRLLENAMTVAPTTYNELTGKSV